MVDMRLLVGIILSMLSLALAQDWYTNPEEGIKKAQAENRLVMFYFHTDHCPYCEQMQDVFAEEKASRGLQRLIVISLNRDTPEGQKWARRFGVFGVPSYVFYDPVNGRVIATGYGSMTSNDLVNMIQNACRRSGGRVC